MKPLILLCDEDCTYEIRLYRLKNGNLLRSVSGRAIAGSRVHVALPGPPLARGSYRLSARVSAEAYRANAFRKKRDFRF